jgi:hypothetical protein
MDSLIKPSLRPQGHATHHNVVLAVHQKPRCPETIFNRFNNPLIRLLTRSIEDCITETNTASRYLSVLGKQVLAVTTLPLIQNRINAV